MAKNKFTCLFGKVDLGSRGRKSRHADIDVDEVKGGVRLKLLEDREM